MSKNKGQHILWLTSDQAARVRVAIAEQGGEMVKQQDEAVVGRSQELERKYALFHITNFSIVDRAIRGG